MHGHTNVKKLVTTLSDQKQVGLMKQNPSYGSPVLCIKSQIALRTRPLTSSERK